MADIQTFKNTIIKQLYPLLNNNQSVSDQFLSQLNESKMQNLKGKISDISKNMSADKVDENTHNSFAFFESLVSNDDDSLGFGLRESFNMPFPELINQITSACRTTLREDFYTFSKIHNDIKLKLMENNVFDKDSSRIFVWMIQPIQVDPSIQNLGNTKVRLIELQNIHSASLCKFQNIVSTNKVTPRFIYDFIELLMVKIQSLMVTLPYQISDNNIDFLMHFYHSNISCTAKYLNMGQLLPNEFFDKIRQTLNLLFHNSNYFTKNIKVLDTINSNNIVEIVSRKILSFTNENIKDLQSTVTKSIYMIDVMLSNIESTCTPVVKLSLDTFDYILMQFINTYKNRVQCVGLMHTFSIIRSLNTRPGNWGNCDSIAEDEIASMLLNSSISNKEVSKKFELEYLLLHRILITTLRKLEFKQGGINRIVNRIRQCMRSCINNLTNDKEEEYAMKYRNYLRIRTAQYPICSSIDTFDNEVLKFWWINPKEELEEKYCAI